MYCTVWNLWKSNLNVLISERVGLRVMHRVTIAGKHKPSKNLQWHWWTRHPTLMKVKEGSERLLDYFWDTVWKFWKFALTFFSLQKLREINWFRTKLHRVVSQWSVFTKCFWSESKLIIFPHCVICDNITQSLFISTKFILFFSESSFCVFFS